MRSSRGDQDIARLIGDEPASPVIRATNRATGLADAAVRLAISAVAILAALVLLATLVSPWFWVAVAACVVLLIATALWFARSGRPATRTRKQLNR
ncbi:MAG: hypothetical protein HY996_10495 [Micrococcales bacterium]|nr:hypothetical protein [Micrococcales bacterium]